MYDDITIQNYTTQMTKLHTTYSNALDSYIRRMRKHITRCFIALSLNDLVYRKANNNEIGTLRINDKRKTRDGTFEIGFYVYDTNTKKFASSPRFRYHMTAVNAEELFHELSMTYHPYHADNLERS